MVNGLTAKEIDRFNEKVAFEVIMPHIKPSLSRIVDLADKWYNRRGDFSEKESKEFHKLFKELSSRIWEYMPVPEELFGLWRRLLVAQNQIGIRELICVSEEKDDGAIPKIDVPSLIYHMEGSSILRVIGSIIKQGYTNGKILEFGSRFGGFSYAAANSGFDAFGIELVGEYVDAAFKVIKELPQDRRGPRIFKGNYYPSEFICKHKERFEGIINRELSWETKTTRTNYFSGDPYMQMNLSFSDFSCYYTWPFEDSDLVTLLFSERAKTDSIMVLANRWCEEPSLPPNIKVVDRILTNNKDSPMFYLLAKKF